MNISKVSFYFHFLTVLVFTMLNILDAVTTWMALTFYGLPEANPCFRWLLKNIGVYAYLVKVGGFIFLATAISHIAKRLEAQYFKHSGVAYLIFGCGWLILSILYLFTIINNIQVISLSTQT